MEPTIKVLPVANSPQEEAAQIVVACLEASVRGQWLNIIPLVFSPETFMEVVPLLKAQRFTLSVRQGVLLAVAGWRSTGGHNFEYHYRGGRDA